MSDVESELVRRRAARQEVVLATVVRVDREPPSRPGEKILLDRSGALAGTLGCSEFDAAAKADSATFLDSGRPGIRTYSHELGTIEVYLEPYPVNPTLLVLGDTPVARELLELAARVGFNATADLDQVGPGAFAVHTDHDDPDLAGRAREGDPRRSPLRRRDGQPPAHRPPPRRAPPPRSAPKPPSRRSRARSASTSAPAPRLRSRSRSWPGCWRCGPAPPAAGRARAANRGGCSSGTAAANLPSRWPIPPPAANPPTCRRRR